MELSDINWQMNRLMALALLWEYANDLNLRALTSKRTLGTKQSYRDKMRNWTLVHVFSGFNQQHKSCPAVEIWPPWADGHTYNLGNLITQSNEENATALGLFGHRSSYLCLWTGCVITGCQSNCCPVCWRRAVSSAQTDGTIKGMCAAIAREEAVAPIRPHWLVIRDGDISWACLLEGQNHRAPTDSISKSFMSNTV